MLPAMCMLLILNACNYNESVNESEAGYSPSVIDVVSASNQAEKSIDQEEQQIAVFTAKIHVALAGNNEKTFKKLIATDKFNVVTVYGGEGVVYSVAHQNKDHLKIKDGELIYSDSQVNPPDVYVNLNAEMFDKAEYKYRLTEQKEGLLENIDWDNTDKDYLTAHFYSFYDQMAWLIDEWNLNDWIVYKLSNNTYLYTKGYSCYSEDWGARVFVGQSFVINRDGDNYGIVAYIDAK